MKILHLEDSDEDAELIHLGLSRSLPECSIQRASNHDQFHAALERGGFDLILSDYTMRGFDGLSALDLARTYCPEKPFIFLSGTIGEERAIEAIKRGAANYVSKDRPARLVSVMKQALTRAEDALRHRKTEEALRQTREHFRHIAENVTDIIMMSDLAGRYLYCNPAYFSCVGRPSSQTPCSNILADVYPEDCERVRTGFLETIETGVGRRIEYRLVRADQTLRCVEAQNTAVRNETGAIVKVLVLARDITDQNMTENRLRQQAVLLDQAQDAILVRDSRDNVTYWNEGAARIYGCSVEGARNRPVAELWDEDFEQVEAARRITQLSGEWKGEMRQRTKSGESLIMQSRWSRVFEQDGTAIGFFVINTDITEKKRLESHLLTAQRTESIGLLAGGVAHDINNLLVPILCSAELLEPLVSSEEAKKFVSMIKSSAQYGAALVQQLLAFARGVPSQKTEVKLLPLLSGLARFLSESFGPSIKLKLPICEDPWLIWGDTTQLKQVFANLCMNARDAMPEGGAISIEVHNIILDESAPTSLAEINAGPYVAITVTDTGSGIPSSNLEKIFDPFFTTKEVGKGTGLGLAAVRGLVRSHEGAITVESKLGQGSTFSVYLPALLKTPVSKISATEPIIISQGNGEGILLVDDEDPLREVLGALLDSCGYRVYKARSGDEALNLVEVHGAAIKLVLTDINMPGMDGFALIENLRRQNRPLSIVAISGMAGSAFHEQKAGELEVPFLSKPVSRETLLTAVSAALAHQHAVSV